MEGEKRKNGEGKKGERRKTQRGESGRVDREKKGQGTGEREKEEDSCTSAVYPRLPSKPVKEQEFTSSIGGTGFQPRRVSNA
jgi:hypothetical protein